jgi:hypothetical protein
MIKFRCHTLPDLMSGKFEVSVPITDKQIQLWLTLKNKPKLTEKQDAEMRRLQALFEIPEELQMSDTVKSCILKTYLAEKYGFRRVITSPEITKGLLREDEAIALYGEVKGLFLMKNEIHFENDYIKGTPDALDTISGLDTVLEFKTSYDFESFFLMDREKALKNYFWQVMGYMRLTGRPTARLVFVYLPPTEADIANELYRISFTFPEGTQRFIEIESQLRSNASIDLTSEERIKEYIINFDEGLAIEIERRVELAGNYLNKFKK